MSLIIHIDTALEKASAGISNNGKLLMELENEKQNEHAAFIQPAIEHMLEKLQYTIEDVEAVGVTVGPGSYTGLRVGMATAKGLCYALNKPLVGISTLEVMAVAAIEQFPGFDLYCPMIDARRQEVYTALFTSELNSVLAPAALIVNEQSFAQEITKNSILFFGNGAFKMGNFLHENVRHFLQQHVHYSGAHLASALFNCFKSRQFLDLAYAEPLYVKDFYFGDAAKPAKPAP